MGTITISASVVALGVAWMAAHIIKYILQAPRDKNLDFTHRLFLSGGMPSSHAATSVAVWTVILLAEGADSAVFGLATLVTLVFCYDAVKVRRSSGEQGDAIHQIIKEQNLDIKLPRAARGHTPLEVFVGALLGTTIGAVVFFTTR